MKIEFKGTHSAICDQMVEFLKGSAYVITTVAEQIELRRAAAESVEEAPVAKAPKPQKAKKAAPAAPEPKPEPEPEPEPEEETVDEEVVFGPTTIDLAKTKKIVMDELQTAFKKGKITEVRKLLADFGNGAK